MKQIVVRGPVLTQSGYGVHSRQIARWLIERPGDNDVIMGALPWGATPWLLNESLNDGLIGKIMQRSKPINQPVDVSFQVQLPNEWDPNLARFNVGVTAAVETDKCNPAWINACNKMQAIVVPSEHVKKALTNTGNITVPLHVIPEAYHDAVATKMPQLDLDISTDFNFLVFGQITGTNPENDRKNIFYTLRWLCEEFANNGDVGIILKTNTARNTRIDRHNVTRLVQKLIGEVRKGPYPRIHLLHGAMSDDEVAALYQHPKVKCFVSLTRGEGYGLPTLEAAASGLPIIATGWSGHMDFLKLGKFIEVYYDLRAIHKSRVDNQIFMEGAKWAEPSALDFKKRVRKFYESHDVPRQWALDLQSKIVPRYSFNEIAKTYESTFQGVL
jgi:glycosyltransferase involved in cell wall biosynthesis